MLKFNRYHMIGVAILVVSTLESIEALYKNSSLNASVTSKYFVSHHGYPATYPNNITHDWHISTGILNHTVAVDFTECSMEHVEKLKKCIDDIVILYDGTSVNDTELGRTCCVPDKHPSYTTTGPNMLIRFITDYSNGESGFRIEYRSIGYVDTTTISIVTTPTSHIRVTGKATASPGSQLPCIIGGTIGGLLLLILLIGIGAYIRYKLLKKHRKIQQDVNSKIKKINSHSYSPDSTTGSNSKTSTTSINELLADGKENTNLFDLQFLGDGQNDSPLP